MTGESAPTAARPRRPIVGVEVERYIVGRWEHAGRIIGEIEHRDELWVIVGHPAGSVIACRASDPAIRPRAAS